MSWLSGNHATIKLRQHIEQANLAIQLFLDDTPLRFKESEAWLSEIEANNKVLEKLEPLDRAVGCVTA